MSYPRGASAALLTALLLLGGCASLPPQTASLRQDWPAALPQRALLDEARVSFYPQEDYECGPAALAMLMSTAGLKLTPEQLVPQVYLPGRQGSLQQELLAASRRQGLVAYRLAPRLETLLRELAAGHPVLVFQNLSLPVAPVWHYALAIGFDRERGELILHSGRHAHQTMPLATFERTWERGGHWAMVALPPDTLPTTAEAAPMAVAIAALERSDKQAARKAYAHALRRWPAQPTLLLGAGNSAYAAADLAAAEQAYRAALSTEPKLADGWNNLAQVLLDQGRPVEARAALQRALELGGPRLALYQAFAQRLDAAPPSSAPLR
ncbi:PA2778 family cysteine peptidase [Roseateles sp. DAIF2]|uniref:PA2778 family cysteine peptidase n=1 Tax=Roseateles sp. DAIF2 TaxID=2714952 RepID=UPI0018A32F14|nr:PA2778 family cysteine peptidase [Roseateles sp. DAIF2]QPF74589.1 PA2778 family cysteine peptidase [Roseateles sp. DAIF2]